MACQVCWYTTVLQAHALAGHANSAPQQPSLLIDWSNFEIGKTTELWNFAAAGAIPHRDTPATCRCTTEQSKVEKARDFLAGGGRCGCGGFVVDSMFTHFPPFLAHFCRTNRRDLWVRRGAAVDPVIPPPLLGPRPDTALAQQAKAWRGTLRTMKTVEGARGPQGLWRNRGQSRGDGRGAREREGQAPHAPRPGGVEGRRGASTWQCQGRAGLVPGK